jgi:signal transduction histidine kinase
VVVILRHDARGVVLEVLDDGIGFDPASVRERGGLGLRGMEERAARIGGQLRIVSKPGEGTQVFLEVCLAT